MKDLTPEEVAQSKLLQKPMRERKRIFGWYKNGKKVERIAEFYNVSTPTIYKVLRSFKGEYEDVKSQRGRKAY